MSVVATLSPTQKLARFRSQTEIAARPSRRCRVWLGELVRYGVTAIVALASDASVFQSLVSVAGWDARLAAVIGFAIGLVVSYALSVRWVFRNRTLATARGEFLIFALIGLVGLVGTVLLIDLIHVRLEFPAWLAKGLAVVIVFGWNFLARKVCLFAGPESASPAEVFLAANHPSDTTTTNRSVSPASPASREAPALG